MTVLEALKILISECEEHNQNPERVTLQILIDAAKGIVAQGEKGVWTVQWHGPTQIEPDEIISRNPD